MLIANPPSKGHESITVDSCPLFFRPVQLDCWWKKEAQNFLNITKYGDGEITGFNLKSNNEMRHGTRCAISCYTTLQRSVSMSQSDRILFELEVKGVLQYSVQIIHSAFLSK